jgi:ABC-type nitrate/sulfonate/bicarbonate transport system substrate-binding protein
MRSTTSTNLTRSLRWTTKHTKRAGVSMVCVAMLALSTACGSDSSNGAGDSTSVKYAVTSPLVPPQLPPYVGALVTGKDFGLDMKRDDLQVLDDTPSALQLLLSGKISATSAAFIGFLKARESQDQLRTFCPVQGTTSGVIVSVNPDVTTMADLFDSSVRVLVESPGGPNDYFMGLGMEAAGLDKTSEDLPNTTIVEDQEQRLSALLAGNADAGAVWDYDVPKLQEKFGADSVTVLYSFTDSPTVYLSFISTKKWLDDNPETAAKFCASVLEANGKMTADLDLYKKIINDYAMGDPTDEIVEAVWNTAHKTPGMWPSTGGLEKDIVDPVIDYAIKSGLITKELTYDDVVAEQPYLDALELLKSK